MHQRFGELKILFTFALKSHLLFTSSCTRHESGYLIMADNINKNGLGVAGFVIALIGLIFSWIPIVNAFSIWLCFLGILLSLIALFLKNKKKGLAIAGLILGIAGVAIYYLVYAGIKAALS